MTPEEYLNEAIRTESTQQAPEMVRLNHAILGMVTEAGELADVLKKKLAYDVPIDRVNLDEEVGDLLWYIALYCNCRGKSLSNLMEMNIHKLRVRFADKFTQENAIERDLKSERKSLEEHSEKHGSSGDISPTG